MPFAVVDGEPVTQLPKDLYIPPDALQVFLEAFEGPLDLLLYLIRRQNLDILDIPIAEITRQYMKYIDVMRGMQLELAGEYLVMAATLAEIKSRMLLPRPQGADEEEADPRAELVRRLQEYERFKRAALDIEELHRIDRDTFPAAAELVDRRVVRLQPNVTLQEMLVALKDVMSRAQMFAHHHISRERLSVRQRMSEVLGTMKSQAFVEFVQLFRAGGRAHGRLRHFHRHSRVAARRADRDRAIRTLCADPRACRCTAPHEPRRRQRPGRCGPADQTREP